MWYVFHHKSWGRTVGDVQWLTLCGGMEGDVEALDINHWWKVE